MREPEDVEGVRPVELPAWAVEAQARKARQRELRDVLRARREAGLRMRHAQKLARLNQPAE